MFKSILLVTILPFSLLGQNTKKSISGTYAGWWADTQWRYAFKKNNIFRYITAGHFGFSNTIGQYSISGDSIFLMSFPKGKQKDTRFLTVKDTLLIDGDSCIIDLSVGVDYCKVKNKKSIIHPSRQRIKNKLEARKPDE